MNWARNNRFLAGFLAVVVVVGGVLTFLLVSAQSRYSDISSQYDLQVKNMQDLQKLPMYPNEDNLKKYEAVRQKYQQEVTKLQTDLASLEPAPVDPPPTPLVFQDRLRTVVDETVQRAQIAGVLLPENFFLGFEQYRNAPPETAATPLLNTQLTEVQNLVNLLIDRHIEKLISIKRALLLQETGGAAAQAQNAANKPPVPTGPNLVTKYPLEIAFTAVPSAFREVLNGITSNQTLYIVRALQVKNQVDKGPSRTEGLVPGTGAPGGSGGPAAANPAGGPPPANALDANGVPIPPLPDKGPPPLRYVVGQERLDVTARIELASVKGPAPTR